MPNKSFPSDTQFLMPDKSNPKNIAGEDSYLAKKEINGMFDGPIFKVLVKLALPIFFGMIFQILYGIVDTMWISRIDLNDPSYVGGVGIIFPLFFLVIALGSGILIGMSSLVARAIGEKNQYVINRTAESGLVVGLFLTTLLVTRRCPHDHGKRF
jgi:Na+-driven multidrug efflux pump